MKKVQTQLLTLNHLPISNELIMYSNHKVPKQTARVTEVWDEDVADFFMSIYPQTFDSGANIADLHQRATMEAFTGIHSVTDFLNFLDKIFEEEKEEDN